MILELSKFLVTKFLEAFFSQITKTSLDKNTFFDPPIHPNHAFSCHQNLSRELNWTEFVLKYSKSNTTTLISRSRGTENYRESLERSCYHSLFSKARSPSYCCAVLLDLDFYLLICRRLSQPIFAYRLWCLLTCLRPTTSVGMGNTGN